MNILKTIDRILATLGNPRAMERTHVDTYTEEKIKNISGVKIAESKEGQFWVTFQELNRYLFMNVTILSKLNLTSISGAKLTILTNEYEIELDTDEKEIESNFSNVSNTWITKVSFEIDTKEREIIESENFEEIKYEFKNEILQFQKVKQAQS